MIVSLDLKSIKKILRKNKSTEEKRAHGSTEE
jgi:hypothetical protein